MSGKNAVLMTPGEAARVTGRDSRTLSRWVREDVVPGLGVLVGQRVFIRRSALERLIGEPVGTGEPDQQPVAGLTADYIA